MRWTIRAVLGTAAVFAMPAQAQQVASGSGAITNLDMTQAGRLFRDGSASTWGTSKPFPGLSSGGTTFQFDSFSIPFSSNALQPIYYEISYNSGSDSQVFGSAYLNSYDPLSKSSSYLGDSGSSTGATLPPVTYQVVVPKGGVLDLVFNNVTSGTFPGYNYTVNAYSSAAREQNFLSAGPGAPAPEVGVGLLSALAAGLAMLLTRMRKPRTGLLLGQ
jgi:hypothetical protein